MEKEKESILIALVVEKEPSAIVVKDPKLLGLDSEEYEQLSSKLRFDLPKLHVIPESYRLHIETLVNKLVKDLEKWEHLSESMGMTLFRMKMKKVYTNIL